MNPQPMICPDDTLQDSMPPTPAPSALPTLPGQASVLSAFGPAVIWSDDRGWITAADRPWAASAAVIDPLAAKRADDDEDEDEEEGEEDEEGDDEEDADEDEEFDDEDDLDEEDEDFFEDEEDDDDLDEDFDDDEDEDDDL